MEPQGRGWSSRPACRRTPRRGRRRSPAADPARTAGLMPSSSRSTRARRVCARSPSTTTGAPRALVVPRVPAALPAAGMGRARRRRHLARSRSTPSATSRAWASGSGETIAGDRHHQPARDRRRLGPPDAAARVHRAIVWQDRRTAARCDELRAAGHEPMIRRATGLVLDPYFSATKLEWLLTTGGVAADADLAFGTVDAWLLWKLTGGPDGGVHATDPSNASRTMLFDIGAARVVRRPVRALRRAARVPARGRAEQRAARRRPIPTCAAGLRVPVSGIAGDQQAALFGQACFEPGMTKNTYGTGSFVLVNLGPTLPDPVDGLLTTVAWTIGADDSRTRWRARSSSPARRSSGCATGSASSRTRPRPVRSRSRSPTPTACTSSPRSPASARRGGIRTRAARCSASRAAPDARTSRARSSSRWRSRPSTSSTRSSAASGTRPAEMRVDGGASAMDLLCQFQADLLGVPVRRAAIAETTALGAAYLAGIAEGAVGRHPPSRGRVWSADASFDPGDGRRRTRPPGRGWHRAVERSRDWERG